MTVAAAIASMLLVPAALPVLDGRRREPCRAQRRVRLADAAARAARGARPARERAQPQRWRAAMHRDAAHLQEGPWYRLSRTVMRRPGPIAIATATLLIVMGLPFLRIHFTGVDASVLPTERPARVVDDVLTREFPPGPTSPVTVVARVGKRGRPAADAYARQLERLDGVASVSAPEQAGGVWVLSVVPREPALSAASKQLVRDIRDLDTAFAAPGRR